MALALLLAGCGGGDGERAIDARLDELGLESRIAQMIAVPMAPTTAAAAGDDALRFTAYPLDRAPGAIWIDSATVEGMATLLAGLAARDLRPLLGAVVDEGVGGAVAGATRLPLLRGGSPGEGSDEQVARMAGILAEEAALLGISIGVVSTPPLLDTPDPNFAASRGAVSEGIGALVDGAGARGLPLALRLFWSPAGSPVSQDWDLARVQAVELAALADASTGRLAAVMPGNATIPSISGDSTPVALSAAAVGGTLRRDAGWEGLVIVDLRQTGDASLIPSSAAIRAVLAGADLLISDADPIALADSIATAVGAGVLTADRVAESARRVIAFKLSRPAPRPALRPDSLASVLRAVQLSRRASGVGLSAPPLNAAVGVATGEDFLDVVAPADAGLSASGLDRADAAILAAIEDSTFTAAALVVGRGGRVVRLRGYGEIIPGGPAVDPRTTIFDLASLTKVVGTTTAVAILVDGGEIELDTPVREYLTDFAGGSKDRVTVRHLLTHTSGLPSGLWLYGSADSREEAARQLLAQPLLREPGEQPEYSDLGMILLAELVERVAGTPIDRFLATKLFVPLGMASTMYLPPTPFHHRIVPTALETERPYPTRGVVHDGNAFRLQGVTGHAGLFATAADVAVFTQMILDGGTFAGVRVLADSTVDEFVTRQPDAEERALGWDTPADRSSAGRFFSADAFGHTGYTGTSIWVDPARDLFVVLLTNRTYTRASASSILDLRIAVHEAVARAVSDQPVLRRPGSR